MPSQPVLGPGQPFLLQAEAVDIDTPALGLQYLWVQLSGPDTAIFDDTMLLEPTVVCNSLGTYVFQLSVTNGYAIVSKNISVVVSNIYKAVADYTAYCGSGSNGSPVTIIADYTSIISLQDAQVNAAALAQAEAYAALTCKDNVPPLVTFTDTTPTISATVTYTAACVAPYAGTPIIVTYTFSDIGRAYSAVESSALTVAKRTANNQLICSHGNIAPVVEVQGFTANVQATATATAVCPEITSTEYGAASTITETVIYQNISYQEAEDQTFEAARAAALAGLNCITNQAPTITFLDTTPQVTATITVVATCPFIPSGAQAGPQKGNPILSTFSYTGSDYGVAESTAISTAYAQATAQLVCAPNVSPNVYIVTTTDLVYRCQVPYRSRNSYRSAVSSALDFLYIATVTASATCPQGKYGAGTFATITATSTTDYPTAEANARAQAIAAAQAQLSCAPTPNKLRLRIFNANANQVSGSAQVIGIYRLLTGTLAVPYRMKFLGAYTLPTIWQNRFLDNLLYLDAYNDQFAGSWSYVLYFGRPHADGSYVFLPDSVQLRLDSVYPSGGASIASLTGNVPAGILSAANGVLNITSLQTLQYAKVSIATAPYLAIDSAGWEPPTGTFAGVMVLQTDAALTTILNYGLVTPDVYSNWTEKKVYPIPFTPTFTDWTTPLTFVFFHASAGAGPLGYVLSSGWQVGPPSATAPWSTDYSLVAWTNASANNQPPYTPNSYVGTPTLSSSIGNVTLPAATQNVASFARTEDVKIILRRYRQKLF